ALAARDCRYGTRCTAVPGDRQPASGAPLATELLTPRLWRHRSPLLPRRRHYAVRNITYFDANALTGAFEALEAYASLGSLLVVLGRMRASATELGAIVAAGLAA
nr:hypothetical protein [Actinomycetota bacterium]